MMKLFFLQSKALACAVCVGQGFPEKVVTNYFWATVAFSIIPILAFGGFLFYYHSLIKKKKESTNDAQ